MSAPTRPTSSRGPAAKKPAGAKPRGRRPLPLGRDPRPPGDAPRPLYTAGGIAAAWAAAIGLAVLMTIALIGWVAAPHATFGEDIGDVFQVAVQGWLVGHQVGFEIPGGHVGMLPLGLVVLPGMLLYRSGRWLARSCEPTERHHLVHAALALAGPYAAISGTLALLGQNDTVRPGMFQALLAGFLLAFIAGGLGVLRQVLKDRDIARRRLLHVLSPRVRALLLGTIGATATLLLTGTLLFLTALILNMGDAIALTRALSPGIIGGTLLIVLQALYLPNAVIFGASYAVGPGFAVGADTMVAPTGVALGPLPQLPMLAALPDNGPAPVLSLAALAAPFLAGAIGGALTLRRAPTQVNEAAPMWGFACGAATGLVCAALAQLAGGPVGAQRLADVGPSAWQVGLVTALEVGLSAAVVAWLANWWHFRTARRAAAAEAKAARAAEAEAAAAERAEAGVEDGEPASPAPRKRGKRGAGTGERPLADVVSLPDRRPVAERTGATSSRAKAAAAKAEAKAEAKAAAEADAAAESAAVEDTAAEDAGTEGGGAPGGTAAARPRRRWWPRRRRAEQAAEESHNRDDDVELFGITYEADGPQDTEEPR
ncbi:cell division protein PerM [Murinocardiopsis flavida]|uniref:cell division protein PerM n=1 Tax=Murinocardiopsis flavida TaxID=645275 RepID=UPI0031830B98